MEKFFRIITMVLVFSGCQLITDFDEDLEQKANKIQCSIDEDCIEELNANYACDNVCVSICEKFDESGSEPNDSEGQAMLRHECYDSDFSEECLDARYNYDMLLNTGAGNINKGRMYLCTGDVDIFKFYMFKGEKIKFDIENIVVPENKIYLPKPMRVRFYDQYKEFYDYTIDGFSQLETTIEETGWHYLEFSFLNESTAYMLGQIQITSW